VSSKREKSSRAAALEESRVATWDILSLLKEKAKYSGRYLGGLSGGSSSRRCLLNEKNHLR